MRVPLHRDRPRDPPPGGGGVAAGVGVVADALRGQTTEEGVG